MIDLTRPRIYLLVLGFALALAVATIMSSSSAQGKASGYSFSDIRVMEATDPVTGAVLMNQAVLSFDYEWVTEEYPGTRSCEWTIFNSEGSVIGSRTDLMTAQANSGVDLTSRVDIVGKPVGAAVRCDERRYDDPSGSFAVSRVDLVPSKWGGAALAIDANWQGSGVPSAQECTAELVTTTGQPISRSLSFMSARTTIEDVHLPVELDPRLELQSATMSCHAASLD